MWDFKQKFSLSRVQTIVGLTAGLLSISFSLAALLKPASNKAELVAVVQDGKTEKALSDAMVEVLTTEDAVISSMKPDWSGKARFNLDEGRYRIRVSHPKYHSEVRDVQLVSKEKTVIRLQLRSGAPLDTVRRLFHH
jgi:Carboxypeptidase regulatory-like domain